jgi:hypothetical protein
MEARVFFLEGSGYGGWIRGWGNREGTTVCWGSLGILLWLVHNNLQGRDFALIWFVWLQTWAAECEWWRRKLCHGKTVFFIACLMNLVCFELAECDKVRWRRKPCYGNVMEKIWQVVDLSWFVWTTWKKTQRNTFWFETNTVN